MELGNLCFGHSRGEFEVPRTDEYEEPLRRLFSHLGLDETYGGEYISDKFEIHAYWWGDCDCGADGCEEGEEHKNTCGLVRPNFWHKPTGYELRFYKYPLRDSYANANLTPKEFNEIIDDCMKEPPQ